LSSFHEVTAKAAEVCGVHLVYSAGPPDRTWLVESVPKKGGVADCKEARR